MCVCVHVHNVGVYVCVHVREKRERNIESVCCISCGVHAYKCVSIIHAVAWINYCAN